ncbi:MAG: hypothetical protein JW944_01325, partial [Deltaproteobacteria bacterium]|nr:hypothetical protein [Deltaproteobacteria bacterium]
MKLKNAFVMIAMLILSFSLINCGGGGEDAEEIKGAMEATEAQEETGDRGETISEKDIASIDDPEIRELLSAQKEALPETSFDRIMKAKEEGKISEQEAMLLTLTAGYNREDLPEYYKSEYKSGRDGLQDAEDWMNENYETLDEETKAAVKPYYVMPDDPESIFNKPDAKKALLDRISLIPDAGAAELTWESMEFTADGKAFDIYYIGEYGKKQAEWIKGAVIKSYPEFKTLLGVEPRETINIYITPIEDYGLAGCRNSDTTYLLRYIKIRSGMDERYTKAVTAHELFHHFQYSIPIFSSMGMDFKWLMEATATWAMHYIYPELNVEHEFLKVYRDELGKNMIQAGRNHEYGSYTWFLFLEQYSNSKDIVRTSLLNAKALGAKKASATGLDNFDDLFSEYGYWNWNKAIAKRYTDTPEFPGDLLSSSVFFNAYFKKEEDYKDDVQMEPLAFAYRMYVFHDKIKRIEFELAEKTKEHQSCWAMVKIGGDWLLENWSEMEKRTFCRERAWEDLKVVVLIFSNSDAEKPFKNQVRVKTRYECEPAWTGAISLTWEKKKTFTTSGTRGSAETTFETRGEFTAKDELKLDEEGYANVVESTMSYDRRNFKKIDYSRACGLVWEIEE